MFHLNGNFWLVRDVAEGKGLHLLEISWHFAPEVVVSPSGDNFIAASPPDRREASIRLTLLPVGHLPWKSELVSEQVSPAYGTKLSAPVVRCSARVGLPAEHAVLLVATVGGLTETGAFMRDERRHAGKPAPQVAYRYEDGGARHWIIFDQGQRGEWNFGPWTSDAKFLYFCVKDRRVDHLVFCEGSFARLRDQALISHDATLQSLEWTKREGQHRLACSDEAAARSFSGDVLNSESLI